LTRRWPATCADAALIIAFGKRFIGLRR